MGALSLAGRTVGPGHPCYVIAEIGPNWCVSADRERNLLELRGLIAAAHGAGADAVKLQLKGFGPGSYYSREDLDRPITDARSPFATRREYVLAREPDDEVLGIVNAECGRLGMSWSASPWDEESAWNLGQRGVEWMKIASASITDLGLVEIAASFGVPMLVSTGMSTMAEVEAAVAVVRRGVVRYDLEGLTPQAGSLALLHCLSTYPAPEAECNLRAMDTLRECFGCPVGWSGHERGLAVTIAAVAMGADIVERHLTLDRTTWGPDHAASLEPKGFAQLVRDIRVVESARGDGVKVPMPSEAAARARLRRV